MTRSTEIFSVTWAGAERDSRQQTADSRRRTVVSLLSAVRCPLSDAIGFMPKAYNLAMHRFRFVLATLLLASSAYAAKFDELFLDKTMRVDYFHTGNRGEEIIALASVVSDGPWPGTRTHLLDTLNLGNYFFEVIDRETNQPIYSRGFASVFGEWVTTDEAKEHAGTLSESVRFPWPRKPVQLVIKKRDKNGAFQQLWSTLIDPSSRFVNPSDRKPAGRVWSVIENGAPAE